MNKKDNFAHDEKYTCDAVIKQGYAIYDEWTDGKYSSRRVVRCVEGAISSMKTNKTMKSYAAGMAHLFALDTRVNEKYKNVIRCFFSYFSWRNETRVLKSLKYDFHIAENGDIRVAIETELENIRENLKTESESPAEDEVRGGKSNAEKREEESTEKARDEQEISNEEKNEAEEKSSEEELAEESPENDKTNKSEGKEAKSEETPEKTEASKDEKDAALGENKAQAENGSRKETEKENNGSAGREEPIIDKSSKKEIGDQTIYSPPMQETFKKEKGAAATNFIDEVLIDNAVLGKSDAINENAPRDEKNEAHENAVHEAELKLTEAKKDGKDTVLYDKSVLEKSNAAKNTVNSPEAKQEQPKTESPSSATVEIGKTDNIRESIQVELSNDAENAMRRSINDNLTEEEVVAIKVALEDAMRERISVCEAEMNFEASSVYQDKAEAADIKMETAPKV